MIRYRSLTAAVTSPAFIGDDLVSLSVPGIACWSSSQVLGLQSKMSEAHETSPDASASLY